MDESTRIYLQMWDRVTLLEPQLREALQATRQLAVKCVDDCFRELSYKIEGSIYDELDYVTWSTALKLVRDAEERRKALIAALALCASVMKQNGEEQADNQKEASETTFAFLRSLPVEESSAHDIKTYIAHQSELMQWRMALRTGGYRACPASLSPDVYEAVLPLIESDTSEIKTVLENRASTLLDEERHLANQFAHNRMCLKAEVKEMDTIDEAADKAALIAAKALLSKLSVFKREEPQLKKMAASAIEICNAVKSLSKRISVVKAYPQTASEAVQQ